MSRFLGNNREFRSADQTCKLHDEIRQAQSEKIALSHRIDLAITNRVRMTRLKSPQNSPSQAVASRLAYPANFALLDYRLKEGINECS